MTACFKLIRTLRQQPPLNRDTYCIRCVYYSKNLDKAGYPVLMEKADLCGLGFLSGDDSCTEMRTDNCRARKKN